VFFEQFAEEVQQVRKKLEECMERMRIIWKVLKDYESEKGDLPSWLSDLEKSRISYWHKHFGIC